MVIAIGNSICDAIIFYVIDMKIKKQLLVPCELQCAHNAVKVLGLILTTKERVMMRL